MKNGLDEQYIDLLKDILENGVEKNTRNGKVLSVFGRSIRYKFKDGKFPLLTTKKMYWKGIVTELLWFLRGDTNIKFLVDNDCHIWDGDAYMNYLHKTPSIATGITKEEFINKIKTDDEFAKRWGELGPVYGKQWRGWKIIYDNNVSEWVGEGEDAIPIYKALHKLDQISNLIEQLKTNPDSRRLMVSAWNVGELDEMVLPPCHYGFQVYTRELTMEEKEWQLEKTNCINDIENDKIIYGHEWENYIQEQYESIQSTQGIKIPTRAISLMWNQRSVDTFLGLPFNIASYGLLLEIIAKEVNMVPDELIGNLGDVHLYKNHIDQAKEQMTREPMKLPTLHLMEVDLNEAKIRVKTRGEFAGLRNYQSHPTIKAPLSN